jgi:hypothetical protein
MADPAPATPDPDVVQVDRAGFETLQKVYKLFNKLWDDPTHGAAVKRSAKAIDPSLRIPEIDVAEPLLAPINEKLTATEAANAKLAEQMEALKQERADEKDLDKLVKSLASAQKRYRLTDDGMEEVKKIMTERGIADPMAAAAYVVSEIEPAKPVTGTNFGPTDANIYSIDGSSKDDSTALLHRDPVKWQDQEISNILHEFSDAEAA